MSVYPPVSVFDVTSWKDESKRGRKRGHITHFALAHSRDIFEKGRRYNEQKTNGSMIMSGASSDASALAALVPLALSLASPRAVPS